MKRHVTMSATNEPRQNFSSKEEMIGVGDYLKLRSFDSSNEYIAYRTTTTVSHNNSRNLGGVIYCNGFRSVMTGNKARRLEEFCVHYNISFTRFDYRGHGQSYCGHEDRNSSSYFETLGLSDWIADAERILQKVVAEDPEHRPQILVGSSMGAWIALHLAIRNQCHVAAIVGLAAAPDFTHAIFQPKLTPRQWEEMTQTGRVLMPSEYSEKPYPISQHFLDDAVQWLLLPSSKTLLSSFHNKLSLASARGGLENVSCPIRLIHGQEDEDIPWQTSLRVAEAVDTEDVQVTLVKSGDHRPSKELELDLMCRTLEDLIRHHCCA